MNGENKNSTLNRQIDIWVALTMLDEVRKNTECNSKLNVIDINAFKPQLKALIDAYQAKGQDKC